MEVPCVLSNGIGLEGLSMRWSTTPVCGPWWACPTFKIRRAAQWVSGQIAFTETGGEHDIALNKGNVFDDLSDAQTQDREHPQPVKAGDWHGRVIYF